MKTPKTYRLGPATMAQLEALNRYAENWAGKWTETDIIEHAINCLYANVEERANHQPV